MSFLLCFDRWEKVENWLTPPGDDFPPCVTLFLLSCETEWNLFFQENLFYFFSLCLLPVCGKAVLVCTLGLLLCLGWAAMICWGFLAAGQSRGTLTFSFAFSRFKTFLSPSLRTKDKMYQLQIWIHQDINSRHLSTQNFSWCLDL